MRTSFTSALLSALVLAVGCAPTPEEADQAPPVDLAAEQAAAKAVVDLFPQVMATEDMDLMGQIFAHDPNMVIFGTDASERWVGWDAFRASVEVQFASYENAEVVTRDQVVTVHPSGEVAWFSEVMDWHLTAGGEPVSLEGMRMTGVLEKRPGAWVFVQMHVSVPVAGQAVEY